MIAKHIVLTLMVGAGFSLLIWQHPPATWGAMQIVGLIFLAGGFVLWTIARFQLGSSFTVKAKAKHLVTSGLYSRIRNPIYIFGSCVIIGVILVVGHPIYLLIFVIIVPLQLWRAQKESAVLEAAFGEEYRKYRAGTWF